MIPVLSDEHKAYIREKTKEKRTVSALRAAIILLFFLFMFPLPFWFLHLFSLLLGHYEFRNTL